MSEVSYDIAVIGGGASGMAAALEAKRTDGHLKIAVIERLPRVGKKLLATGNGRCNITNMRATQADYHGLDNSFVNEALKKYPPIRVIGRFSEWGLECIEEDEGRVYPVSSQAASVLDVLRLTMKEQGIGELCGVRITGIRKSGKGVLLMTETGNIFAKKVIIACGGQAAPALSGCGDGYRLLEQLGHKTGKRVPALVQLKCDTEGLSALKGVRCECGIDILVNGKKQRSEDGELLFTEYGVSGIAVMQLSRIAATALAEKKNVTLNIRFTGSEIYEKLLRRREALKARSLEDFLTGMINKRLGQIMIKRATGLQLSEKAGALTDAQLNSIASLLSGFPVHVVGTQGFEQAQVTAGGVLTKDFDASTMMSKIAENVYACGEVLDIDGDCGGYNLQWAWASGMLAGKSAAEKR